MTASIDLGLRIAPLLLSQTKTVAGTRHVLLLPHPGLLLSCSLNQANLQSQERSSFGLVTPTSGPNRKLPVVVTRILARASNS